MDKPTEVEVKVTWKFVWSLSWRMWLLTIAFMIPLYGLTFLIIYWLGRI